MAGSEKGWEATTVILVTGTPVPKGSGLRMKTREKTEEETLDDSRKHIVEG